MRPYWLRGFLIVMGVGTIVGCGTTRSTDTNRAATEMLLISSAIDQAVAKIDFAPLAGKTVFLDVTYLDGVVDRGYLISSIRQHLAANGALLMEERLRANYIVEVRAGSVGTDRYSLMLGIPAVSVPISVVPGAPTQIPEIAFAKKTDQQGFAKLAVYAYHRVSGKALWQSGTVEGQTFAKDSWFMGAGPFRRNSLRKRTQLAGSELPSLTFTDTDADTETHELEGGGILPTTKATFEAGPPEEGQHWPALPPVFEGLPNAPHPVPLLMLGGGAAASAPIGPPIPLR